MDKDKGTNDEPTEDEDDEEGEPLWGKDGPEKGQVVEVRGTGTMMRWTGHYWEMV